MNAFYICGLEAKYAEEFNRNTRRLSQTGESSEVWPISKNRKAPHLNKLGSLCRTLVRGWVENRWGLCEGSELPGTSSSLESGQAKTGEESHAWTLCGKKPGSKHCGHLAETFFPSPGARLSLIFRVRFGHSGQTSQFVTCLMDYLLVSTFYVRMTNYIVLAFRDTCLLLYHTHDGKVICFLLSIFFRLLTKNWVTDCPTFSLQFVFKLGSCKTRSDTRISWRILFKDPGN